MMNRFVKLYTSIFLSICALAMQAQEREIKGFVTTEGNALTEVTVTVKGTTISTVTESDGVFYISLPKGKDVLVFSASGMVTKEEEIGERDVLNIELAAASLENVFELSLSELSEVKVISASNILEKLSETPATTIVITADEIRDRGYVQIHEIFSDLPGMQVSRPYGMQQYYRNYWRGYRNATSEPYLLMVDGLIQNDMYFGSMMHITAVPISNIERVEVVYGPTSAVYGANAFMGIVNIITKKDSEQNGSHLNAQTTFSLNNSLSTDIHVLVKKDELRLSLAGKFSSYQLSNFIDNNSYEYLKDSYQTDQKLWGGLADAPEFGASTDAPRRDNGFDARILYNNTELGMQLYTFETGWGYEYPTDRALISTLSQLRDFKTYFKHKQDFTKIFSGRFLMAFRGNYEDDRDWIEGYNTTNSDTVDIELGGGYILTPGSSARIIDHSTWQTYSHSYLVQQDFDIAYSEKLIFNVGLRYEQKNFSNQVSVYGEPYFPDSLKSPDDEGFLSPGTTQQALRSFMHIQKDYSTYLQTKYKFLNNHLINVGVRIDNNSHYGTYPTLRAGYVGHYGNFITKLIFGQAYQTPMPRMIYGSWEPVGWSPNVSPEESNTIEANINYNRKNFSSIISCYRVNNTNTVIQYSEGAKNAGKREIIGADIHIKGKIYPKFMRELNLWGYYSLIVKNEEMKFDIDGNESGTGIIGDLSHNNAYLGLSGIFTPHISLNILGRYVGERKTIETNPVPVIDPYFSMNASLLLRDIFMEGFHLRFTVNNILNTQYFHPGIKNADAGEEPGSWSGDSWNGSTGWYNSRLPQPHRHFLFSMLFQL